MAYKHFRDAMCNSDRHRSCLLMGTWNGASQADPASRHALK